MSPRAPGRRPTFAVRLLSWPAESILAAIEAFRALHGLDEVEATRRMENPPVVLRQGVDGAEAERVRRIFAPLGVVEVLDPLKR